MQYRHLCTNEYLMLSMSIEVNGGNYLLSAVLPFGNVTLDLGSR